jgi:sugar/nucleoside kinase (ribokinase family)
MLDRPAEARRRGGAMVGGEAPLAGAAGVAAGLPAASGPRVVVVGSASRDLDPGDPRGWRLGGGVSYGALTTARLGLATAAVIGVDEEASGAAELDLLRGAGVDVHLVPLAHGPVFDNVETPAGRIQVCHGRSDPIPPSSVPEAWRDAGAWILDPVADEIPDGWAAALPGDALVALGWQGMLRTLRPGRRVRRRSPRDSPLVRRADILGVGRDDLDPDVTLDSLCRLARDGATLCVTDGANGGIALLSTPDGPERLRRWPAIRPDALMDPTGAGDAFLAAFLAARVEVRLVAGRIAQGHDLLLAATVASLTLEGPGLLGVPGREAVRRRIARGLSGRGGAGAA